MIHELKILPQYFEAVTSGDKTFEVRKPDRDYEVGDYLALNEYKGDTAGYTGRCCLVKVIYILDRGLIMDADDVIVMSIEPCQIISNRFEKPHIESFRRVAIYERTATYKPKLLGGTE